MTIQDENLPAPEQGQTGESGASPAPEGQESARGPVPYDRFKAVNDAKNAALAELEKLRAERGQPPQNQSETPPDPPTPAPATSEAALEAAVGRAMERILSGKLAPTIQAQDDRVIAGALGINRPPSEDERKAIAEVHAQHPGLALEDATLLAAVKSPDVFGGNGKRHGASNHQPVSRAPGSHHQPPAEEEDPLLSLPATATKKERSAAALGHLAKKVQNIRQKRGG